MSTVSLPVPPNAPRPQILATPPVPAAVSSVSTTCCEGGRPVITDPLTGVCSCTPTSIFPRVTALTDAVYTPPGGAAYIDPALYSSLSSGYAAAAATFKDGGESAWRNIYQPVACYPYDTSAAMAAAYPYPGYNGMDLNGSRRKNATRESTSTLKAWLQEHIKNPYPTKGEKIMLAIITKMTLTQVSTWFANARRRLKKENKMTWSPRNRCDDDDDDDDEEIKVGSDGEEEEGECLVSDRRDSGTVPPSSDSANNHGGISSPSSPNSLENSSPRSSPEPTMKCITSRSAGVPSKPAAVENVVKPKIWSLAHTATSDSPPPSRRSPPPVYLRKPTPTMHTAFGQYNHHLISASAAAAAAAVRCTGWTIPYPVSAAAFSKHFTDIHHQHHHHPYKLTTIPHHQGAPAATAIIPTRHHTSQLTVVTSGSHLPFTAITSSSSTSSTSIDKPDDKS
ncbi:uncharacterized protein LOC141902334 isoform X2 [Tubulanus polymorphus]